MVEMTRVRGRSRQRWTGQGGSGLPREAARTSQGIAFARILRLRSERNGLATSDMAAGDRASAGEVQALSGAVRGACKILPESGRASLSECSDVDGRSPAWSRPSASPSRPGSETAFTGACLIVCTDRRTEVNPRLSHALSHETCQVSRPNTRSLARGTTEGNAVVQRVRGREEGKHSGTVRRCKTGRGNDTCEVSTTTTTTTESEGDRTRDITGMQRRVPSRPGSAVTSEQGSAPSAPCIGSR